MSRHIIHPYINTHQVHFDTFSTQKTFHFSHAPRFDLFEKMFTLYWDCSKEFLRKENMNFFLSLSLLATHTVYTIYTKVYCFFFVHYGCFFRYAYDFVISLCRWMLAQMCLNHFSVQRNSHYIRINRMDRRLIVVWLCLDWISLDILLGFIASTWEQDV